MESLLNQKENTQLCDIFDINRQSLEKTYPWGTQLEKDEFYQTVHICIFNKKGEILINKRQPWKKEWSGMWDFVISDCVRTKETSRQAASRKLKEELGINIDLSQTRPEFTINANSSFEDYYIIQKEIKIENLKNKSEDVASLKWATKYEVHNLAAKHQMIPYVLFDFVFEIIEQQILNKK